MSKLLYVFSAAKFYRKQQKELLVDSVIVLNLWCLERSDGSYQVSRKYNVQTFSGEIIFSSDESNYYFSTQLIHWNKEI